MQKWTINGHTVHTWKFSACLLIKSNQFVLSAHSFGSICIILFPLCLITTFSKNSSLLFQFANLWIFKKKCQSACLLSREFRVAYDLKSGDMGDGGVKYQEKTGWRHLWMTFQERDLMPIRRSTYLWGLTLDC